MRNAGLWVLSILLSTGAAFADDPAPGSAPVKDAAYPALRLPTIEGRHSIDLRTYRGTRLLLIEFASW